MRTVWIDLAFKFNDKNEEPSMVLVKSAMLDSKLQEKFFTAQHSEYVATPDVLKKKFGELQTGLRQALAGFQISGQGDCATDEKIAEARAAGVQKGVAVEASLSVFSADFHNFTKGDLLLSYCYEAFMKRGLVGTSAGVMPAEAKASSTAP